MSKISDLGRGVLEAIPGGSIFNRPPPTGLVDAAATGFLGAVLPGSQGLVSGWLDKNLSGSKTSPARDAADAFDSGAPTTSWTDIFTQPGGPGTRTYGNRPVADAAPQVDPFAELDSIRADLEAAAGKIDADYQARLAELQGMYQLAETPEERAQLQFVLGNIEAQRESGHTVIRDVYADAVETAGAQAEGMRGKGNARAQTIGNTYRDAAGAIGGHIADAQGMFADEGLGVGATPVGGGAGDWQAMMQAAAPREQALAQQLTGLAADQTQFLGDMLGAEGAAQQGELERLAMQMAAQATIGHQGQVSDRINQDRRSLAGQSMQLGNRYEDRGWAMEDTALQMAIDLAEQRRLAAQVEESAIPEDPDERKLFAIGLLDKFGIETLPMLSQMFPELFADIDVSLLPTPEGLA